MGHLAYTVRTRFEAKMAGDEDTLKFYLYSGHDTTVMPFLDVMGVWDGVWAPYASLISIELYNDTDTSETLVRVVYNGKPMILPECSSELCSAQALVDALDFAHDS